MKRFFLPALLLLLLFLMLSNPQITMQAALEGLTLWYSQVLPSLFPAMILTSFLVRTNLFSVLLSKVKCLPTSHASGLTAILCGLLCGYPIGAKTCFDLYETGQLSQKEVRFYSAFVHYPSPMFLLGFVSTVCFPEISPQKLLASLYLSGASLGILSWLKNTPLPKEQKTPKTPSLSFSMELFDQSYNSSVSILIKIAGYLMIFTLINRLLQTIFPTLGTIFAVFGGILEMTCGIRMVSLTKLPVFIKHAISIFFLGFGGLSGMLQVRAALSPKLFFARYYLSFRFLHGFLAVIVYLLLQNLPF